MTIYKGKIFSKNSIQIKTEKNGEQYKVVTEMVTLFNLLDAIPNNNWTWWLYDFEGSVAEGENLELPIIPDEGAYAMKWKEVKQFSMTLGNVTNCLLIATVENKEVD
ncbi:hypothetical protein, partial [Commensalibacter nepenthis]